MGRSSGMSEMKSSETSTTAALSGPKASTSKEASAAPSRKFSTWRQMGSSRSAVIS